MKRILAIGLILTTLFWFGLNCSEDEETPTDAAPTYGSVSGIVSGENTLAPLEATVRIGNLATTANESGYFAIGNVPVGETVVEVSEDGFLTTHRTVTVLRNQTTHLENVVMMIVTSQVLNQAGGGRVDTDDGSVEFDAGIGLVDAAGQPYTGEFVTEVSAMLPTNASFFEAFPGEFEGRREDDSIVPFQSFGFMGVNLADADRAGPLNLADGETAQLEIPVTGDRFLAAPDTIPMWYFDESEGVWIEDGFAYREGDEYIAEVSHFTTWNWDLPIADIGSASGQVLSATEMPVLDARVFSKSGDAGYMDEVYTSAGGLFVIRVLKNSTVLLWAMKGSYASEPVEVLVGAGPFELEEPLVLREPAFAITLAWGEFPDDLDAHFYIPATWDEYLDEYHLYYGEMGYLDQDPYTALDTDDTNSFGPEIISGFQLYQGTYRYYVHNYSEYEEHPLSQSGATVYLEIAGQARTFRVATATGEDVEADSRDWWHVFDLVVGSNSSVSVQNRNRFESPYSDTGRIALPAKR